MYSFIYLPTYLLHYSLFKALIIHPFAYPHIHLSIHAFIHHSSKHSSLHPTIHSSIHQSSIHQSFANPLILSWFKYNDVDFQEPPFYCRARCTCVVYHMHQLRFRILWDAKSPLVWGNSSNPRGVFPLGDWDLTGDPWIFMNRRTHANKKAELGKTKGIHEPGLEGDCFWPKGHVLAPIRPIVLWLV